MMYQVNPDGTIRFINNFSEQTAIACKRAKVPESKRPVSKDTAKRIIREWIASHS